jgi:hypothetical protein
VAEEDEEEYEQEEEEQEEEAGGDELDGADGEGGQDDEEERDLGEGGVVKSLVSPGYDRAVAASAVATVAMERAPANFNTERALDDAISLLTLFQLVPNLLQIQGPCPLI